MKKLLMLGVLLLAFVFGLSPQAADARSGCCSWHGGVNSNGTGCNDGTPLSSTCAPYYSKRAYTNITSDTKTCYSWASYNQTVAAYLSSEQYKNDKNIWRKKLENGKIILDYDVFVKSYEYQELNRYSILKNACIEDHYPCAPYLKTLPDAIQEETRKYNEVHSLSYKMKKAWSDIKYAIW